MLASFVAEPLLTGLGAGGYMLVVPPDGEPVLLDFFVEASGRGADLSERAPLRRGRRVVRRRRAGLPHRRGLVRHVRHAGRRVRGRRSLRHRPAGRPDGARGGARARRGDGQQRAGVRVRDPRADLLLDARVPGPVHARGAGAARGRRAARPRAGRLARAARRGGRGAVLRGRHRGGDLRPRVRARRHADPRRPGRLRGRAARAGAGPLPRPRGAHQPAAERGRHAARLRARAAAALVGPARRGRRSWRRWSAPRPSARRSS